MCFLSQCLAVAPLNELVTYISRLLPRHVFPLDCFVSLLWSFSKSFLFFMLAMFSSFMSLFVYIHTGWKSQTQEDAARNKAALSFSLSFLPLFSSLKCTRSACLGFPNYRLCWGSLESNSAIIAGWSGLASAGEGKWTACYGVFQILASYKVFIDYIVVNFTRIYLRWQNIQCSMRDKEWKMFVAWLAFSHLQALWKTTVWLVTLYICRGQVFKLGRMCYCCILGPVL